MVVIEGRLLTLITTNLPTSFISHHINLVSGLFIRMYCCVYGNLICEMYPCKEKLAEEASIQGTISHVVEASREEEFCISRDGKIQFV